MPRDRRLALAVALAAAPLAGCNTWYNDVPSPDALVAQVPWFDHMISSRAVFPYSRLHVPRNTPAGTVPVTGGEVDWSAEWATGNTTTADRLVNPAGSRAFASAAPKERVQAHCFEPLYHELFNESPELAEPVLERLQHWLAAHG